MEFIFFGFASLFLFSSYSIYISFLIWPDFCCFASLGSYYTKVVLLASSFQWFLFPDFNPLGSPSPLFRLFWCALFCGRHTSLSALYFPAILVCLFLCFPSLFPYYSGRPFCFAIYFCYFSFFYPKFYLIWEPFSFFRSPLRSAFFSSSIPLVLHFCSCFSPFHGVLCRPFFSPFFPAFTPVASNFPLVFLSVWLNYFSFFATPFIDMFPFHRLCTFYLAT